MLLCVNYHTARIFQRVYFSEISDPICLVFSRDKTSKQLSNSMYTGICILFTMHGYSNNRKILFKPKVFAGIHK